jgi:type II secretory pathway pseudopilin PulG
MLNHLIFKDVVVMKSRNQSGFTLTELAIVFVLIGLLIGSFLKFREMITATKIKSVALQWDMVKNATISFKDKYGDLPGDIRDPDEYISNLRSVSDGFVAPNIDGVPLRSSDGADRIICYNCRRLNANHNDREFALVWRQLYAAEMLHAKTDRAAGTASVPDERLFSEISGAEFFLMTDTDANAHAAMSTAAYDGQIDDYGLYLHLLSIKRRNPRLFNTNQSIADNAGYFLNAKQAFEIDKKFDDGANIQECDSADDPCRMGDIRYSFDPAVLGGNTRTPFGEEPIADMQLRISVD